MSGPPDAVPTGFAAQLTHDGKPMAFKGARYWWEGDFEMTTQRFTCDCGLTAEVTTREMDGGPEMVRRREAQS